MKNLILIIDDSNFNREFLSAIIETKYEVHCENNGKAGINYMKEHLDDIFMLLLDIVMPEMDGFDVLSLMQSNGWIYKIPVVMISSESTTTYVNHAFDLGAIDYISRPFSAEGVFRRIDNAIHKFTTSKVTLNDDENNMIQVLSNLVEFRNGETGLHLLHIKVITSILLNRINSFYEKPLYTDKFIHLVSNASALHDIGKISIPSEILNKPGRLTKEEFEIMKTHSAYGAKMIEESPNYKSSELLQVAYKIARWHHEKIDGKGYPDGLVGDQIPIYVQVVSIADCYDALTSERCYKKAIPQDKAIQMIVNGECGQFSKLLTTCLQDAKEELLMYLDVESPNVSQNVDFDSYLSEDVTGSNAYFSNKIKTQLDIDRLKNKYVFEGANKAVFEYNVKSDLLTFSILNFDKVVDYKDETVQNIKNQITNYLKTIDQNAKKLEGNINMKFLNEEITYNISAKFFIKDDSLAIVGKIFN